MKIRKEIKDGATAKGASLKKGLKIKRVRKGRKDGSYAGNKNSQCSQKNFNFFFQRFGTIKQILLGLWNLFGFTKLMKKVSKLLVLGKPSQLIQKIKKKIQTVQTTQTNGTPQ